MIGVVDYDAGNIASVKNALASLSIDFCVSSNVNELSRCGGLLLPGVGAAPGAMRSLREKGLVDFLQALRVPLLGICLGMQVLFEHSEEGDTDCLGILPGTIARLDGRSEKIPHMGWNDVAFTPNYPLAEGIGESTFFYFAHSYYVPVNGITTGTSDCGLTFAAAIGKSNFYGVQFHPEKSGAAGFRILKNFEALCRSYPQ